MRRFIRRPRKPVQARLAPPEFPGTPNPTTRILSHRSGVWLTLRSRPRRAVRKIRDCHTGNDVRRPPLFGHAEARFTMSANSLKRKLAGLACLADHIGGQDRRKPPLDAFFGRDSSRFNLKNFMCGRWRSYRRRMSAMGQKQTFFDCRANVRFRG